MITYGNTCDEFKPKKGFFANWLASKRQYLKEQRKAEKEDAFNTTVMFGMSAEHLNAVVNGLSVAVSDLNLDDGLDACAPGLFAEMVSIMDELKGLRERTLIASEKFEEARIVHEVMLGRSYAQRMATLRRELGVAIDEDGYDNEEMYEVESEEVSKE